MNDDRAASETLGVVLCVGITIFMFGAMCVPILSWCNGKIFVCSEGEYHTQHGGNWGTCDLANSDKLPVCNDQGDPAGLLLDKDGKPNCHPIIRYSSGGHGKLNTEEGLVCEIVATLKDPLDRWHE